MFKMNVYDCIAEEFSKTRYRVWKSVKDFLDHTSGIRVIEAGCGNGKNLLYAQQIGKSITGFDFSQNLVDICQSGNLPVIKADILNYSSSLQYDLTLCIAVIHHLETPEKRFQALETLYHLTRSGGTIMISVWSYETEWDSVKSHIQKRFHLGDNLVEWKCRNGDIQYRYYYIYSRQTLCEWIDQFVLKYPNVNVEYEWQEQNWIVRIHVL